MAFLEVSDLRKSFGETEILKSVSFSLEKGEILSIIGSSGSGKTTLLRCLNFLEKADGGTITVDGRQIFSKDAAKKTVSEEERTFGLVFQGFNLFPQYTALDNVALAMNAEAERKLAKEKVKFFERKKRMSAIKEINRDTAKNLLEKVGLGDKLGNYPCELSGGQSQRVAIARALAMNPAVLCFDEPTSALDPELTGEVLRVIKGLKNKENTMIIVTHEMNFARNVSDKVVFMADGKIEAIGTPEFVFEKCDSEKLAAFLKNEK